MGRRGGAIHEAGRARWRLGVLLGLVLGTLAACAGPNRLDSADAGRTVTYLPGVPNFDLEATPTWDDGAAGLDVYIGIPHRSLSYIRQADSLYQARYDLLIRVLDERGRTLLREVDRTDTVAVATYEATLAFDPVLRIERIPLAPGTYVVEATVTDAGSEGKAVRRQRVTVDDLGAAPALSPVRLEGRRADAGDFEPIVALHVPELVDSLRAVIELYTTDGQQALDARLTLLRFVTDTTIATQPYWVTPSYTSLAYRGVRYDDPDTLQVTRRRLDRGVDEAIIEFSLPPLDPGVYRVFVDVLPAAELNTSPEPIARQRRDLSVQPAAFPEITRLTEMVDALTYIAYARELREIEDAVSPLDLKARFDAFWGALFANRREAAQVIERYYSRVEEANLRFTTVKPGWKTDRGMTYILLGAPLYVDRRPDVETWHYSYASDDPRRTFTFERVRPWTDDEAIFETYVLRRAPAYERVWRRAVERWRAGKAL